MGSYYYLISQLPTLSLDVPAPISIGQFRSLCSNLMKRPDFVNFELCTLDPQSGKKSGSPFIDSWIFWERSVRLHLARSRAGRLKRDVSSLPEAPSDPLDAVALIKTVMAIDSPLEAERFLDMARWTAIERFQGLDYFDRDTIYAYYLKLLILERRSKFRAEEGFMEYKKIYASVMEAAPNNMQAGEPK